MFVNFKLDWIECVFIFYFLFVYIYIYIYILYKIDTNVLNIGFH